VFNTPTTDEVGVIVVGEQHDRRDIVLETRGNSLQRIAVTHRSYDALQYPLIFWAGDDGYKSCEGNCTYCTVGGK